MKTKLLTTVVCILSVTICNFETNAQTWTWGKNVASMSYSATTAKMVKSNDGSFLIADTYFDSVKFGTQTFVPVNSDFYITKHDSSGNLVWSITDKGLPTGYNPSSYQCQLASIDADKSGNVFAFGNFGYTLSTQKGVFLAKYNGSGTKQWSIKAESASLVASAAVCSDDSGNVYITGHTSNTITFYNQDGTTPPNNVIVTSGTEFLAKYNSTGVFKWVKEYKNASGYATRAYSLNSTADGILLSGYCDGSGTVDYGNSITLTVTNLKKAAFITKYDFNGLAKWVLKAEGTDRPFIAITLDNNSDIIMCGKVNQGGIGSFTTTSVASVGFLGKANSSGTAQWVNYDETSPFKYIQRVGVATNNTNILVTGTYVTNSYIAVQRFDNTGKYIAVDSASNDIHGNMKANAIITTSNGSFYLAGSYCSSLIKGSVNITSPCGIGKVNFFVAKISPTGGILTSVNTMEKGKIKTTLFPNPSNGNFILKLQNENHLTGNCRVEICNMLGETVYSDIIKQQSETEINLSNVSNGIYFIKINDGEKSYSEKISIQ